MFSGAIFNYNKLNTNFIFRIYAQKFFAIYAYTNFLKYIKKELIDVIKIVIVFIILLLSKLKFSKLRKYGQIYFVTLNTYISNNNVTIITQSVQPGVSQVLDVMFKPPP